MKTRTGDEYILLEDSVAEIVLPLVQQQRLEMVLAAALQKPTLWAVPSPAFVADLERNLLLATRRRQRLWYWLGAAGGGALSLLGGALVWHLWRKQRAHLSGPHWFVPRFRGAGV